MSPTVTPPVETCLLGWAILAASMAAAGTAAFLIGGAIARKVWSGT